MVPVRGMKKTSLWKSRPWPSRRAYVKLHSSSPFHPLLPPFFSTPCSVKLSGDRGGQSPLDGDSRSSLAFPPERAAKVWANNWEFRWKCPATIPSTTFLLLRDRYKERSIPSARKAPQNDHLFFFFLRWNRTKFLN